MFGFDFYPTPQETINKMVEGLDLNGKTVWEPSAGAGHIVKALQEAGARVIACEIDEDLRQILEDKCEIIANDCLTVTREQISHIDYVVMNPPFSQDEKHILHCYNIMPEGCKLIALCNLSVIKNPYNKSREELKTLVETYGGYEDLGDCFSQAERKTHVDIALIRMEKPGSSYETEFEGFFMEEDEQPDNGPGLMPYNVIRDLVNRYIEAVKIFDQQLETAERLNTMTGSFFKGSIGLQVTHENKPIRRNEFKKGLQKEGWTYIFSKLNMQKYATSGLKEDINKFVEKQDHIPFTMRNIYKMLEIVIGTNGSRMDKAIMDVFDRITRHHDDNKFNVEGWKTNSHYLLTRRFIMPHIIEMSWSGKIGITCYSERYQIVDDLIKSICYLTGDNYDDIGSVWSAIRDGNVIKGEVKTPITWGKWFEWAFFKIRVYKKGTIHFEFKDEKVWALFNQRVAKLKGYPLHEKKEQTAWQRRQNGYKEKVKPIVLETIDIS